MRDANSLSRRKPLRCAEKEAPCGEVSPIVTVAQEGINACLCESRLIVCASDTFVGQLPSTSSEPEVDRLQIWDILIRSLLYISYRNRPYFPTLWSILRGVQEPSAIIGVLTSRPSCVANSGRAGKIRIYFREFGTSSVEESCTINKRDGSLLGVEKCLRAASAAYNQKADGPTSIPMEGPWNAPHYRPIAPLDAPCFLPSKGNALLKSIIPNFEHFYVGPKRRFFATPPPHPLGLMRKRMR